MAFEVETHPEAVAELDKALRWYAQRSDRAPECLLREYDAHVAKIRRSPDSVRFIYREYRRLNLDRFPFAIVFRVGQQRIFIIAVMHERRHPDYWKHRIDDDRP